MQVGRIELKNGAGRRKVTVVGAGNVGSTCALELARRDYADIVLVDIIPSFPQGKALDMNQAGSVLGFEPNIVGTNGYDETEGSDVVVITAGKPRSPGMSRDDLVTTNEAIVGTVTREIVKRSRDTPETRFATWHIASSGFETTIRIASGEAPTTFSVTSLTIFSFVVTRSSRLIPGLRGSPAVITTTVEPADSA